MRKVGLLVLCGLGLLTPVVSSCGGGRSGPAVHVQDLGIASTLILKDPNAVGAAALFASADQVDWEVPLVGGCGGPYVVSVVQGALPAGIAAVDDEDPGTGEPLHHLRGTLLEDGVFSFRLQVVDTSCDPFLSTYADFTWNVARGQVAIVGAVPALIPVGELVKNGVVQNPLYPALKTVVYNQFTTIDFVIAGGTPPYSCQMVDDPNNADDGPLPLGTSIPPFATTIVGAPVEVKPGGAAFVFTVQAVDSTGQTGQITVQWQVDTPPIIIANTDLPDGKAGEKYSETIVVVDGVPPMLFEFVQCDVDRDVEGEPAVTYQSPLPPVITPACATQRSSAADYPGASDLGPDYRTTHQGSPPEGVFLGDEFNNPLAPPGALTGTPRRRGDFRVIVHVFSSLVPNERGQHNWRQFEFSIADSEPPVGATPAFGQNAAYTKEGAFAAAPPYARIAEAEVGVAYNPDAASHPGLGLQLLAAGGVRKDGLTDAPHASEVTDVEGLGPAQEDASTSGGGYDWTVDPNPPGDGDAFSVLPPGMTLDGWTGVWRVGNPALLQRQSNQALAFTVLDQQLPLQTRHAVTQRVNFAVGPDKVIITESTLSDTTTSGSSLTMNDHEMTVKVLEPFSGVVPAPRVLNATDLSATHAVPSTTGGASIDQVLATQDFLRVSVNPSGWWDDVHGLSPDGARPFQHGDPNKYYPYYGMGYGQNDWQPAVTAVELPRCTTSVVAHDPTQGVYKDGGKLYAFGNANYFGVFIVRGDSSITLPCAFSKTTYSSFGDAWVETYGSGKHSALRMPQLAVSPDGRFGAMKLKTSETNVFEGAASTKIVVFTLTGEKSFGGQTWKVIDTGASGTSTTGVYLYGPSLTLTNSHLYYLCGNYTNQDAAWRGHFLYRYELANGAGAVTAAAGAGSLLPSESVDADWGNTSSNAMQTPFQKFSSLSQTVNVFLPSGTFGFITTTSDEMYIYDGGNVNENAVARHPFRVSRDGRALAVLAARDPNTTSSTDIMKFHVWVDFQGSGVRRISAIRRYAPGGAGRIASLGYGPNTYPHWLRYTGPTTQFEISDDASKVAVVVNRNASTVNANTSAPVWYQYREDVVAFKTTNNWSSSTEMQVTGDDSSGGTFAGSAKWRFGSLAFTKDSKGLVFWAGVSQWDASSASTSMQASYMYGGSIWGCDLSLGSVTVTSLLPTADGGTSAGIASYTSGSPYNPTLPAGSYANGAVSGVVKPLGGFYSANREFYYIATWGALATSKQETMRLVAVNVRSVNTGQNVNGNTDFRAFASQNWPTRRGFVPNYYYFASYPIGSPRYYAPGRAQGGGMQVMARDSGNVFFASHYQASGPTTSTSSSFGGPVYATYWADYGAYGGEIEGFNSNIGGPIQRLTNLGGNTTVGRAIHFIETTHAGQELAYVYDTGGTNRTPQNEQIHYVGKIGFTPAAPAGTGGALANTPLRLSVEGSGGRAGESMAFSFQRDKLYYAFGPGASNENAKNLYEASIDLGTGTLTKRQVATGKRFNVLHSGR